MPVYEYVCTECGERTEVKASLSEKEKGLKVTCPGCGSTKMAQVFGNFTVMGKSGGNFNPPVCGPGSGPSCCS